jgi:hypothetical protein
MGKSLLWIIRAALFNTTPDLPADLLKGGRVIHFLNFSYLEYIRFIIPSTRRKMYKPHLLKSATKGVAVTRVVFLLLVALSATAYAQSVVVLNFTAVVDVAKPDFVMDVNGCSVYVYVVRNIETAKTPSFLTVPETSMPASPMDSEEILDAFIKALGPRLTAYVTIVEPSGALTYREVEISVHNSTELRRAIEEALGASLARNLDEARSAAIRTWRATAYPKYLAKKMEDAHVYLFFLGSRNGSSFFQVSKLIIEVTQWEKALDILSRIGEAAGGRTPPAYIYITPYWADKEEIRRLDNVAMEFYNNVFVKSYGRVGPYIVKFTYPSGKALPDRATAEKVVRRFIELAGVCRSPMVVEFWREIYWLGPVRDYISLFVAAVAGVLFVATVMGVAAVATAAVFILKKRRTN